MNEAAARATGHSRFRRACLAAIGAALLFGGGIVVGRASVNQIMPLDEYVRQVVVCAAPNTAGFDIWVGAPSERPTDYTREGVSLEWTCGAPGGQEIGQFDVFGPHHARVNL